MRETIRKTIPVIVLAVIGICISFETEILHRRLAENSEYTTFCNISGTINCDVVLSSRYATQAGISVSVWSILYHVAVLVLAIAVATTSGARLRVRLSNGLLALVACGVVFSAYMAFIAFAMLHTVCLMCSGLYLVAIGLLATSWRLRRDVAKSARRQSGAALAQDRVLVAGSIIAVAALVVVAAWEVAGSGAQPKTAEEIRKGDPEFYNWYRSRPQTHLALADAGNARGAQNAGITIVEFSDFGCAHCNMFHQAMEEVWHRQPAGVRVVFRHFPLDSSCNPKVQASMHPQSCLAAIAAECAGEQGKFWEYHNLLFDNQRQLEREFLITYATRLHLDMQRFTTCLGSPEVRTRVERDAQLGGQLGIDSTPTVFINGRTIKGALDAEGLSKAIVLAREERGTVQN